MKTSLNDQDLLLVTHRLLDSWKNMECFHTVDSKMTLCTCNWLDGR